MKEKIVLIDGNSIVNRAFFGLPDLTTSTGKHTNGILGFLNILLKLLDEEKPEYLTVAFDVHHKTFRHEIFPEYKGTRKGMPEELCEQMPVLEELLNSMNILVVKRAGYEADDILGTLAKRGEEDGLDVTLVSGDRDLLQIASDTVLVRLPKTKGGKTFIENYHTAEVVENMGVRPERITDLKGLMGDSSDNIPGVPGVGPKTAVKLLNDYDDLEGVLAHADEVAGAKLKESLLNNKDLARLCKKLATIKTDCELPDFSYEKAKLTGIFTKEAYKIVKDLELKSLLSRFELTQNELNDSSFNTLSDSFKEMSIKDDVDAFFDRLSRNMEDGPLGLAYLSSSDNDNVQTTIFEAVSGGMCCIALSGKGENILILPENGVTAEYVFGKVEEYLEKGGTLSCLNIKEIAGFIPEKLRNRTFDTFIAAYLCNPLKDSYTDVDIARDYLFATIPGQTELIGKADLAEAFAASPENVKQIMVRRALIARESCEPLKKALSESDMLRLFTETEMPLEYILYEMEKEGIYLDRAALKEYGEKLAEGIGKLEREIYDYVGEEFNINSPKQLGVILFEKLKLPFGKKTKTGYSTSADVLEKIKSEDPVIEKILTYRTLTKLKSTYADGLAEFIGVDGRVHTKFNQTITATGRLSSTEPNLQNIPARIELGRQIRKLFTPKPGHVFVDADYSQIELRILAHMSGDESLIKAYHEAQDIHRMTASKVFGVPFEEVTPQMRSNAKAVNFGIVYGISSFGLGQDLNISRKEAENYIKQYFETYPGIKSYLDGLVKMAKEKGYVTTLYGRRRPVPEINSSNFMQRQFGERIAMNSPIQGTGADIMKFAMIRVANRLKKDGLKAKILLQIHDELLIEAPKDEEESVKRLLKEEMMAAAELKVPLEVEVKSGDNWYETK
ncbi:MAG: DNA polymerase I [Lachnospiraceae bacterium]|nr:DNA polymerase I [Lachnospiraceae bacterium]